MKSSEHILLVKVLSVTSYFRQLVFMPILEQPLEHHPYQNSIIFMKIQHGITIHTVIKI